MEHGEHFSGFEEAHIAFPPTFKYDILQTLKKSKSVKAALKKRRLKGLRRKHHQSEDSSERLDVEDIDEESSESSDDEDHDEPDSQSITSSAVRSSNSQKAAERNDEEEDPEFDAILGPAAQNAISNANLYASEMHAAAHRAKEKFLALVQRPASPSMDALGVKSTAPIPIKKPKSLLDSPKSTPVPLGIPPFSQSATSSFDLPRPSIDGLKPPPLRQTQSLRSESPVKGQALDELVGGVYDTSSKQRVPSW